MCNLHPRFTGAAVLAFSLTVSRCPAGEKPRPEVDLSKKTASSESREASRIIDELVERSLHGTSRAPGGVKAETPPVRKTKTPPPPPVPLEILADDAAPTANSVVSELIDSSQRQDRLQANRDSQKSLEQAQTAIRAGKWAEALKRTREASKSAPDDVQIAELLRELEGRQSTNRAAAGQHSKAKAYLAAALSRGQELLAAGRYSDGVDILNGVVEASAMFPEAAGVDMYRRAAQRALDEHQANVKAGKIGSGAGELSDDVPLAAVGVRTPENLPRLLRGSERDVPAWYSRQKTLLSKPISVDYRMTAMSVVFEDIAAKTGCRIIVDDAVIRSSGHSNQRLDLRASAIPAESILDIACQKSGLEYVLMENAIAATSPARAIEYVRQLPLSLRRNWGAARILFPSMNPDLFASPPTGGRNGQPRPQPSAQVPDHLSSGSALSAEIRDLLGRRD